METTTEGEVAEINTITEVVAAKPKPEMASKIDSNMNKVENIDKMDKIEKNDKVDKMNDIDKKEKPIRSLTREVTINADETPGTSSSNTSAMQHSQELAARRRQFMSQPSTVATRRQQAVCVRRAHKSYGPKNNPNVILDGLNMTVPKGSMYVLIMFVFYIKYLCSMVILLNP